MDGPEQIREKPNTNSSGQIYLHLQRRHYRTFDPEILRGIHLARRKK